MARIFLTGSAKDILESGDFPGVAPELISNLTSLGHVFTDFDSSEAMISLNHTQTSLLNRLKKVGKRYPKFLVRIEPDSVFPAQFSKRVTSKYVKVFTLGHFSSDIKNFRNFPTAYRVNKNPLIPSIHDPSISNFVEMNREKGVFETDNWLERSGNLVLVASNKASPSGNQNYFLRRRLIKENLRGDFDVYGIGWAGKRTTLILTSLKQIVFSLRFGYVPRLNTMLRGVFSDFPKTNGFVDDKHELLQGYKFNIIIENSSIIHTEKIFDAFINGTIPIYFGPELDGFGIPNSAYIRFDGSLRGLHDSLMCLEASDFERMRNESTRFISSNEFQNQFSAESVYSRIASSINLYLTI
jgi:hypothetical protein